MESFCAFVRLGPYQIIYRTETNTELKNYSVETEEKLQIKVGMCIPQIGSSRTPSEVQTDFIVA